MKGLAIAIMLFCFSTIRSFAQETGEISGNISDSVEAVIGGVVVIEGNNTLGGFTDVEGNFVIKKIKPGTYNLVVTYFGFKPLTIKDVKVEAGKTTDIGKVQMQPDAVESQEVIVTGVKSTNTEESAVKETKESKQVVNVISAEQISKSQDRDAGQVMQRVPGVTIVDNRFVLIRGLSERYNVVMINDAIAPNTEVERRSFSFDLIPSQMLDRISVYKTGAADLPGDFAAGVVKVYTKNMPDKNYFNVNITGGYRNGTTFKDYNNNYTGKTEFLGFGDKSRDLPNNFPTTAAMTANNALASQKAAALLIPNRLGYTTHSALPDLRFNIDFGRKFRIGNVKVGNVTALSYTNLNQTQTIERHSYGQFDPAAGKSDVREHYLDNRSANTVRLGVVHNWSAVLSSRSKIDFKNFFNQQSENETVLRNGVTDQRSSDSLQSSSFRYQSRSIFTSQLGGKHDFKNDKSSFSWTVGYSYIYRNIPDWRRNRSFKAIGSDQPYQISIPGGASLFDAANFYSKLNEHVMMTSGNFEHKFAKDADSSGISLKVGYYLETRSRKFEARWMSYEALKKGTYTDSLSYLPLDQIFTQANITGPSPYGFKITEGTNQSDQYTASNQLYAGYGAVTIPLKKLNIQTGIRLEAYHQQLNSATSSAPVKIDTLLISPLPFLNTAYNFTKKSLLRFASSRTVNRAEFRELAPFVYYDFDLNTNFVGNPNLKMCNINNLDLRYEFYPSANEMISLGVFYKHFNNPIEFVIQTAGGEKQFNYQNSISAENKGVELEIRKSLANLNVKFVKDISILFNGSLITSKVHLDTRLDSTQAKTRALQGQSPYVINTGLYYNNEAKGLSVTALYNVFGKRIFSVGNKTFATIYEMPRHSIDLTIQKKLSEHWEGRVGVQDLLNYKTRFMQDSNNDGKITSIDEPFMVTRRGTYITLGVQYRF
jgi:TonB-dependent receptor